MSEDNDNLELGLWIGSQALIVVLAFILCCCHYSERSKFKKKLVDFRDVRDAPQQKNTQIEPLLGLNR